jgi:hypothetical protein
VIDRAFDAIDQHRFLAGMVLCVLPLILAIWFSGVFEPQSRRAAELQAAQENESVGEPHNIFDDVRQPQEIYSKNRTSDLTEEDCRRGHGIYDGTKCVIAHLAN